MAYTIDNQGTTWVECASVLAAIIGGARPEDQKQRVMTAAIAANLITSEEQEKACPSCGKPKFDFRYWRVTAAGRLLVNAFEETQPSA